MRELFQSNHFDPNVITIWIGIGSSLLLSSDQQWHKSFVCYFDVPKNDIQYRSRARYVQNFASKFGLTDKEAYKRFYFVDWPILNRHKAQLLSRIDIYVDDQRDQEPTWMRGHDLRQSLTPHKSNTSASLV